MSTRAYFPTLIYYDRLASDRIVKSLNKDLVSESYILRDRDRAGKKWCAKNYPGGYTSYGSVSNLHQRSSAFIDLEKRIRTHVHRFAATLEMDLKGKRVFMTDCWINIMPERVMHGLHLHPLSFISGTYYIKTPKGCSSIKFEDPRLDRFMAAPAKKSNASQANRQFVHYEAAEGNIVLFESWLRHEVAANPVKEDRISVSFNYSWE